MPSPSNALVGSGSPSGSGAKAGKGPYTLNSGGDQLPRPGLVLDEVVPVLFDCGRAYSLLLRTGALASCHLVQPEKGRKRTLAQVSSAR